MFKKETRGGLDELFLCPAKCNCDVLTTLLLLSASNITIPFICCHPFSAALTQNSVTNNSLGDFFLYQNNKTNFNMSSTVSLFFVLTCLCKIIKRNHSLVNTFIRWIRSFPFEKL